MLLAAGILALLTGPVLLQLLRAGPRTLSFLDGFAFITIAGLVCFGILPQALDDGGLPAWGFTLAGLLLPVLLERVFQRVEREAHLAILVLAAIGLALHAMLDGIALGSGELHSEDFSWEHEDRPDSDTGLALAALLHRLPEGIAVWYLTTPTFGPRLAWALLALLIAGTAGGFFGRDVLLASLQGAGVAWFQSFVAGSIMHVVVHGLHGQVNARAGVHSVEQWPQRLGSLCGLILLFLYL
jgi:zinc transporter ZupT